MCPHDAFPANDGSNNFAVHEEAYLSHLPSVYDEDYFMHGKKTGKSLYDNYRWLPELTIPMCQAIVDYCGIVKRDRVLDFGCARGYVVKALRQLGYDAYGTDVSRWAIDNCDEDARPYLNLNANSDPPLLAMGFDWIIAKDVLEHIPYVGYTITQLMSAASKGVFAVVPLAPFDGSPYVVEEYEGDVTHVQRLTLGSWIDMFVRFGWRVEASYRVPGVKDNYAHYKNGNGFITARRI